MNLAIVADLVLIAAWAGLTWDAARHWRAARTACKACTAWSDSLHDCHRAVAGFYDALIERYPDDADNPKMPRDLRQVCPALKRGSS